MHVLIVFLGFVLVTFDSCMHTLGLLAVVVKNRVTPTWVALVDGNLDDLTCGPIPGGLILTHTQLPFVRRHVGSPKILRPARAFRPDLPESWPAASLAKTARYALGGS